LSVFRLSAAQAESLQQIVAFFTLSLATAHA